jgi:sirohydrochlorin ferrochelatase
MPAPLTILMDNGSLEPAAALGLRGLAAGLGERIGERVEPVSLLHSSAVPGEKLGGTAAEILEPALERRLAAGRSDFVIVPLFFGPSGALTDYLPKRLAHLRGKHPALKVQVAQPLFAADDDRLARILADQVRAAGLSTDLSVAEGRSLLAGDPEPSPTGLALHRQQAGSCQKEPLRVALVDHGSPAKAVTAVRNELACQLAGRLGPDYLVAPCSMERREGAAYDFCEPLLAGLLRQPGWHAGEVTVAMQFLLPGRHAGADGDVATICRAAEAASGGALRTTMTALVGEHPLLVDILADRWRAAAGR